MAWKNIKHNFQSLTKIKDCKGKNLDQHVSDLCIQLFKDLSSRRIVELPKIKMGLECKDGNFIFLDGIPSLEINFPKSCVNVLFYTDCVIVGNKEFQVSENKEILRELKRLL